jgi:hypothetical protein
LSKSYLTDDFENELSKNFCAMKFYYSQSARNKKIIALKAEKMSKEQLKNYVAELGNIIT